MAIMLQMLSCPVVVVEMQQLLSNVPPMKSSVSNKPINPVQSISYSNNIIFFVNCHAPNSFVARVKFES